MGDRGTVPWTRFKVATVNSLGSGKRSEHTAEAAAIPSDRDEAGDVAKQMDRIYFKDITASTTSGYTPST